MEKAFYPRSFAVGLLAMLLGCSLSAAPLYLDTNGATSGAGADGSGHVTTTWDSSAAIWNTDINGAGSGGGLWVADSVATFSAGSDATGTLNLSVVGTHSLAGLTVNAGTLNLSGVGVLSFAGTERLITVASGLTTTLGVKISGTSTAPLTKAGTGTLVLSNAGNDYSGPTLIQQGALKIATDYALPATTDLSFGTTDTTTPATTTGALDLSEASLKVKGLNIYTNSATANTVTIGEGKTFEVTGAVNVGPNYFSATVIPLPVTKLTMSGDGEFLLPNSGNRRFVVGGVISSYTNVTPNRGNSATLDMSELAKFTADLGSGGTFQVGDTSTNSSVAVSTVIFAKDSFLKTGTLTTAAQNVSSVPSTVLKLGTGSNVIHANTLTIGMGGGRAYGTMSFLSSTGTLTIRGYAGGTNDRAAMTVGFGIGSTSNGGVGGSVDLRGHEVDLKLSTLQVAGRTHATAAGGPLKESLFSFDQGILDATGIEVGFRSGPTGSTNAGSVVGGLNLGSATDTVAGEVIIGAAGLKLSDNQAVVNPGTSTSTNNVTTIVNIAGMVNVSIGATGGTSIMLGNAVATGFTATATLNLTGGVTTVAGDIVKGTGAGYATVNATLTLDGGTLDLGGGGTAHHIGSEARPLTTLNFRSGILKNVAGINGGADLIKTTTGTLLLTGANSYSGGTQIQAGTLQVGSGGAGQSGLGSLTVSAGATLAGTGRVQGVAVVNGSSGNLGFLKPGDSAGSSLGTLSFSQSLSVSAHSQVQLQIATATLNDPELLTAIALGQSVYDTYLASKIENYKDTALNAGSHDFLNVDGSLTLGTGTSGGVIRVEGSYTPVAGDVFHLMDWSGLLQGGFSLGTTGLVSGGQIGDLYLPMLSGSYAWDVSHFASSGILVVVIPEPSRWMLVLVGLTTVLGRRRKR